MISVSSLGTWLNEHPERLEDVSRLVRRMQAQQCLNKAELKGPRTPQVAKWLSWVTDLKRAETPHADQYVVFQNDDTLSELRLSITHVYNHDHKTWCAQGAIVLDNREIYSATAQGWDGVGYERLPISSPPTARAIHTFFRFLSDQDARAWEEMLCDRVFEEDAEFFCNFRCGEEEDESKTKAE